MHEISADLVAELLAVVLVVLLLCVIVEVISRVLSSLFKRYKLIRPFVMDDKIAREVAARYAEAHVERQSLEGERAREAAALMTEELHQLILEYACRYSRAH